eukprot:1389086-Rhodomonas_salina.1
MPHRTFVRARANGQKRLARTKVRVACQRIVILTVCTNIRMTGDRFRKTGAAHARGPLPITIARGPRFRTWFTCNWASDSEYQGYPVPGGTRGILHDITAKEIEIEEKIPRNWR